MIKRWKKNKKSNGQKNRKRQERRRKYGRRLKVWKKSPKGGI